MRTILVFASFFLSLCVAHSQDKERSREPLRIAVMPPFLNGAGENKIAEKFRDVESIHIFTQAHLVSEYEVRILDRSSIGAAATFGQFSEGHQFQVLPADFAVISVFDARKSELVVHPFLVKNDGTSERQKALRMRIPRKGPVDPVQIGEDLANLLGTALKLPPKDDAEIHTESKEASGLQLRVCLEILDTSARALKEEERSDWSQWLAESDLSELEGNGATIELVDRESLAQSLDEGVLSDDLDGLAPDWSLPVDLILSVVPMPGEEVGENYLLMATSPQTSSLIGVSKREDLIGGKDGQLTGFIKRASIRARNESKVDAESSTSSKERRKGEADIYRQQAKSFLGYRMTGGSVITLRIALYQAQLGLLHDFDEEWLDTIYEAVDRLNYYQPIEPIRQLLPNDESWAWDHPEEYREFVPLFRRHFKIPIDRLGKFRGDNENYNFGYFAGKATLGEFESVLDEFDQLQDERLRRKGVYAAIWSCILLEQYDRAVEIYLSLEEPWSGLAKLIANAHRVHGKDQLAYEALKPFEGSLSNFDVDTSAWYLKAYAKREGAVNMLNLWAKRVHAWKLNKPPILLAVCEALEQAGGEEKRIKGILAAVLERKKDRRSVMHWFKPELKKLEEMAKQYGVPQEGGYQWTPAEQGLLSNYQLEICLDTDMKFSDFLREACQKLADFWGYTVVVYPKSIPFSKMTSYDPVREAIKASSSRGLLHGVAPSDPTVVERIFLTNKKLVGDQGDVYRTYGWLNSLASIYYVNVYHRRLPDRIEGLTSLLGQATVIEPLLKDQIGVLEPGTVELPLFIQPSLFADNGYLSFYDLKLKVGASEKELFGRVEEEELDRKIQEWSERNQRRSYRLSTAQREWIDKTKEMIANSQVIEISPRQTTPQDTITEE